MFESKTVQEAKKAVSLAQNDPESAKFDGVTECANHDMAQGFVNSKNLFGAYSGRSHFIYTHGVVFQNIEGQGTARPYLLAEENCRTGKETGKALVERIQQEMDEDLERQANEVMEAANAVLSEADAALGHHPAN